MNKCSELSVPFPFASANKGLAMLARRFGFQKLLDYRIEKLFSNDGDEEGSDPGRIEIVGVCHYFYAPDGISGMRVVELVQGRTKHGVFLGFFHFAHTTSEKYRKKEEGTLAFCS